ncbi:MAG: glycosyltransferase [Nanoarchaeota archaeon]
MKPIISVIIPVYNEENRIKDCLESIYSQNFDANKVEVLIVDDNSNDKTLEIVKKFPVKVFKNGKRDYDVGKAIGIENAKGRFLLFIDADNRLIDKTWITRAVNILEKDNDILGVQSWKLFYSPKHNLATRYQDLFGNTDPAVFYLKNQDHLQAYENKWELNGEITEDKKEYVIVKFRANEIPTIGSQGFLTRKIYFEKQKIFQHIEFFIGLIEKQKDKTGKVCFLKNEVEHLAFSNVGDITKKFKRNIEHYLKDEKKGKQKRYSLNFLKVVLAFFVMITLIVPIYDSFKGYLRKRDNAWFLHIYLSFIVAWVYGWRIFIEKLSQPFLSKNPS